MTRRTLFLFCCFLSFSGAAAREIVSFDEGWRFARFGPMPDGSHLEEPDGLEAPDFDDSSWRVLNVPHDWGIEGPFRMDLPNQTGKLLWAGIGWYRKIFASAESDPGRQVYVDFDGAMCGATVYVNGEYVGEWPYGHFSFRLDLTGHLRVGGENVLAVRLDNKPESSRWYPGGGIYRHVRLVKVDPLHVAHWGVFATTPLVSAETATVKIETALAGDASGAEIRHEITVLGSDAVLASGVGRTCFVHLDSPKLWDLNSPRLYSVNTTVSRGGGVVDTYTSTFGICTIEYTPDEGFLLNGRVVRMNGVCQHHDLGPLGTAINLRALERQIEILKEMGVNAIRTSHNPPAPELLDLCDRMGMLVQVEAFDAWARQKAPNDYAGHFKEWHERDVTNMVRRDRNHPSVVMRSTGNEVIEFMGNGGYFQVSSYDLYAPNWAYRPDIEFEAQDKYPWVLGEFVWTGFDYIGEPTPYNRDQTNLLNFTDPVERERMKKELEELGGDIPPRSSYSGIVDLCGFPKDRFYMYQARWRPDLPMAHILPHWNWPERIGKVTPVHVYTSGDEAELFLNGRSLGRKEKGTFEYRLRWDDVVYEPGELVVVAYKDGREWVKNAVQTTGKASALQLSVDRNLLAADGADLAFVTVEVVDAKSRLIPRTHNAVRYSLTGPGEIIAVGNGDPTSHDSFQAAERKVFNGKALVVIRSIKGKGGQITLGAESEGLRSATTTVRAK